MTAEAVLRQPPLITVYCGSRAGHDPAFAHAAEALGQAMGQAGLGLVYGGAHVGLMGRVAEGVLACGQPVLGIMPEFMLAHEVARQDLTELRVVASLHERKGLMAELGSAFVALPGGFGTLEELTEVACWAQLHHHDKPMLLLNLKGYYDPLLAQLDRAVQEGFMSAGDAARLQVFAGVEPLMAALLAQLRWAPAAPVFTTSGSGCGPA